MLRTLLCLIGLVGGGSLPGLVAAVEPSRPILVPPAEPPIPDRSIPADELIRQLSAPGFRVREAAARQLVERAEEVLPTLRQAVIDAEPEARRRLATIIQQAERAQLFQPRRVTLEGGNRPLKVVLEELHRQTGYRVITNSKAEHRCQLKLVNVPFWEAVDELARDAGLVLQAHDPNEPIVLYDQSAYVPYLCYTGPFRINATGFYSNKQIQFATLPRQPGLGAQHRHNNLQFQFMIGCEPRLPLVGIGPTRITLAEDDLGQSLKTQSQFQDVHHVFSGSRSLMQWGSAQLGVPARAARTVRIKGVIPVTLLSAQQPLREVADILRVKKKSIQAGKIEFEIEKVIDDLKAANTVAIHILAKNQADGAAQDWSWQNSLSQRFELHDAKGNRYQSLGLNPSDGNNTPSVVQGFLLFGKPGNRLVGPPAKLVYFEWKTIVHQVEFEFKNLPLP